ncbi:uncharacterized protein BP01DRAFT_382350 [Aspergillus saccharolyticus JOP 1030-1]|uniref:Uncharacterized protein n=1 Tax=Aspergillus saccharolyticus JOP 1030-1 TaxID=1450539 RepID=A0A318ZP94_9EURO|nr:hypothetical protein BP01DRAFT_382350 [Aspergillus saccharolyticus JOP 1030-1]PYH45730.1 hypothetical protein BP01DRAFT_382350 [Aspergillus saccharolyticus JOP 1030-1]
MEATLAEDKMEMASPYQGHIDDFDIDIDIMEDQVSTTDKDMMLADDFQESISEVDHDQGAARDADMTDDIAERTMADAEDAFADEGYNIEMQYGSDRVYEAEMLEDDYDEDVDAPVTDVEAQPSLEPTNDQAEQHQGPSDGKPASDGHEGSREQLYKEPNTEQEAEVLTSHQDDTQPEPENLREPAADQVEDREVEKGHIDTNEAEHGIADSARSDQQVANADQSPQVQAQESNLEAQPLTSNVEGESREEVAVEEERDLENEVEHQDGDKAEGEDVEEADANATPSQDVQQLAEQGVDVTEHEALYPVKVYYQETEISLFPPREGDSSETFFLEDESLAYGSFAKLLGACRDVLKEHVSEKEVLIMDVDALNLQLVEDSMHIDKITLSQIVDLYLRLCHNEGINEPEPLYLSLSTRLTLSAELSELLAAANEGKGLTDVLAWDSYAEAEAVSAQLYVGLDEEPYSDLPQEEEHASETKKDENAGIELSGAASISQQDHDKHDDENETEHSPQLEVKPPTDNRDNDTFEEELADKAVEAQFEAETEGHAADFEHSNEQSYHYEEQSESSATITQLPPAEIADEGHTAGESTSVVGDQPDEDQYDYHDSNGDDIDGSYAEENARLEDFDASEEADQHETGENVEEAPVNLYDGTSGVELQEADQERSLDEQDAIQLSEKSTAALESHENFERMSSHGNDASASHQDPEVDLNEVSQDGDLNTEPTLNLAEDAIGVDDNLLENSNEDHNDEEKEVSHADEFDDLGDFENETEHVPSVTASHNTEDNLEFDDDYLDLEFREELGEITNEASGKSPSQPSTKRHREPEDEVELIETPSPDAKRSRSS